jgi:hypothetical protein
MSDHEWDVVPAGTGLWWIDRTRHARCRVCGVRCFMNSAGGTRRGASVLSPGGMTSRTVMSCGEELALEVLGS